MANLNELQQQILKLKKEKNALVLAHYYVPLEVQDIADAVCDSFAMAKLAKDAKERIIVICGVTFMAESAKLLSPDKKVLLPVLEAGCPMADMVTPEDITRLRTEYPNAKVMCYVNSSAAVKAESDICCTSSSALELAEKMEGDEFIFVPDKNLGAFVAEKVPNKQFHMHNGYCPVHDKITAEDVLAAKKAHPDGLFLVHPECPKAVLELADFIGSTAEILDFARSTDAKTLIIGTECEITARLKRELPDKDIHSVAAEFVCETMKYVTLQKVYDALSEEKHEITLDDTVSAAARKCLDLMVSI